MEQNKQKNQNSEIISYIEKKIEFQLKLFGVDDDDDD
jgi:hypothetical protein